VGGNPLGFADPYGLAMSPARELGGGPGTPQYDNSSSYPSLSEEGFVIPDHDQTQADICEAENDDDPFKYANQKRKDSGQRDLNWRDAEHYFFAQDLREDYPEFLVDLGVIWEGPIERSFPWHQGSPFTPSELYWGFRGAHNPQRGAHNPRGHSCGCP
jgi:hypothetical protein